MLADHLRGQRALFRVALFRVALFRVALVVALGILWPLGCAGDTEDQSPMQSAGEQSAPAAGVSQIPTTAAQDSAASGPNAPPAAISESDTSGAADGIEAPMGPPTEPTAVLPAEPMTDNQMPSTGEPPTAGASGDGTPGTGSAPAGMDSADASSDTGFGTVAVAELSNSGAYTAMTIEGTGPEGNYTMYLPEPLAPNGAKNPVIAWISGGGSQPSQYELLPHLASHGFVVIASNTVPQVGQQRALGEEMVAAVDWILEEVERADSDYSGKVDGTKVAAMGFSMGALAATAAGADPRWTTTVHISGGAGDGAARNLHAPAAFLCGASGTDIAGANCATDYEQATSPVFFGVFNGGDHLAVRTPPYADRIAAVVTGWLRWQLMGDEMLKSMFVGDGCTVCTDSNWTVEQKNLQ